jgi:succinylglutamic semialdehyde dehydrogenase
MTPVRGRGDFIDGRFVLPQSPSDEIAQPSPADLDDTVGTFPLAADHVDLAVLAARRAQPAWDRTDLATRIATLQRFGEEIHRREAGIVALLGREIGKPAWEAKTEVGALVSKIAITVGEGLALVRGFELDGGKLACRYRPHGVLAVIGPYNFPLHLPHGHIVPALATGNTVVFKPSEMAPACAQIYAEAAADAGFPPGVLNVVQGRGPAGAALSSHPDIDGLLFTGSYETGCRILAANAERPGRMLALELGGKNAAIVLKDAPWEKALHDVTFSAFVTAGQRCTSVSRVVVDASIADRLAEELVRRAGRLSIGEPTDPEVFMGPLTTHAAVERFNAAQNAAIREGAGVLLATRTPHTPHRGHYVTPSIHRVAAPNPASPYQAQEIFGPDIAMYTAGDLDEACTIAEATPYGLAAGVFTQDAEKFEACAARLRVGCLTWNAPTVGSSSRLPFGGVKNSGNHRPAALFSSLYCAYPLAITRGGSAVDAANRPPGMGDERNA